MASHVSCMGVFSTKIRHLSYDADVWTHGGVLSRHLPTIPVGSGGWGRRIEEQQGSGPRTNRSSQFPKARAASAPMLPPVIP